MLEKEIENYFVWTVERAGGKTYKQLAYALDLSQSTVRNHLHNVYHKLAVVDRAQAVIVSRENGWI